MAVVRLSARKENDRETKTYSMYLSIKANTMIRGRYA